MFEAQRPTSRTRSAFSLLELIYHSIVRDIRKNNRNPLIGLLSAMMKTIMLVAVFYVMFTLLGMKRSAIRGDFVLYLMSGIMLFLTHNNALKAVLGSEGPTSAMMKHAPMNTIVAIVSSALSSLYVQVLSMATVLYVYHILAGPITIYQPVAAFGMLLAAWFSGVAIGLVFLGLKPWIPGAVNLISSIYLRANMITSGKMFVANTLPGYLLVMFDWNPLFHTIDQARGYTFINYNPHFSSESYPIKVGLALIIVGLMLEFYTRRNASVSWSAGK